MAQNGAESVPTDIPVSCLKTMLPVEWKSIYLLTSTFRKSLCGMVLDKMLKSKAERDLAFFLTLLLFSLVAIGK